MATVVFEHGLGILPGERVELPKEEVDRRRARQLAQLAQENAAEAAFQARCAEVDKIWVPILWNELQQENAKRRPGPKARADFAKWQAFAARRAWPDLEAPPQAIMDFLVDEFEHGSEHVSKLVRNLSIVFRAVGMPDATDDNLIHAFVKRFRADEAAEKKGN